jgi:hypothetical protein
MSGQRSATSVSRQFAMEVRATMDGGTSMDDYDPNPTTSRRSRTNRRSTARRA